MLIAAQRRDWRSSRGWTFGRSPLAVFAGATALLFTVSATATARWCSGMAGMGEMPMPGGWTMSMAWMRMPGQTALGAAASLTAMWALMMVAMMLPSLAPALWRYREAVARSGGVRPDHLAALAGAGYFLVWTVIGMALYPLGVSLAAMEMQLPALARAVPMAASVVVLLAGTLQFTPWKVRHLMCCREAPGSGCRLPADAATAWRFGLRLGVHCSCGCAGLTAILLVLGVMELRAMALVTTAITAERLAPNGARMARVIGAIAAGAGVCLIARAAGLA